MKQGLSCLKEFTINPASTFHALFWKKKDLYLYHHLCCQISISKVKLISSPLNPLTVNVPLTQKPVN